MIYITGDIHGDYQDLILRIESNKITKEDHIIVLGDAGLNYYLDSRENKKKKALNALGIKILFLRGNHEARPENVAGYEKTTYLGIKSYVQPQYPNLIFLSNGIMTLEDKTFLVANGAYSVDKFFRLEKGYKWFEDEQLYPEEKEYILQLIKENNKVDYVLSHTAPTLFEPTHLFLSIVDQSAVDKSTERFLQEVLNTLDWNYLKHWYFGHYHSDEKLNDKASVVYRTVQKLGEV